MSAPSPPFPHLPPPFPSPFGKTQKHTNHKNRYILDTQLVCAMGPPSGGRQVISARTQSRFNLINLTFPSDAQVTRM